MEKRFLKKSTVNLIYFNGLKMSLFDSFYINFYTISMIQTLVLYIFSSLFLLLLPEKSKSTLYLGVCLVFSIFVTLGYVLSQGIYYPTAFPRVITLIAIPFHFLLYPQFLFRFPKLEKPKTAKHFLYVQVFLSVLSSIYVIYAAFTSDIFYDFQGHYFDYNFPKFLKIYGLFTLIYVLIGVGVGIWKTIKAKDDSKVSLLLITIGVAVAIVLPAIGNVLNKAGLVERDIYVINLSIFNLAGVFIIMVSYINKTTDRSTFMFKIIGISFLVFMLIYNSLGYFIFNHREKVYNLLQQRQAKFLAKMNVESFYMDIGKESEDVEYVIEYNTKDKYYNTIFSRSEFNLPEDIIHKDLLEYTLLQKSLLTSMENPSPKETSHARSLQSRIYREDTVSHSKFVAFRTIDSNFEIVHEVGFSYTKYRQFIHEIGKTLLFIYLTGVALIIFGTPLFLSGALVKPLKRLLDGLRKVRKGNLDINLPVQVQDEIGFLTQSFNSMVKSIKEAKIKLEEYSNHLEEKVVERTKELQTTLTQVETLKTQQDGDYFLTTLLLKPLGTQTAKSDKVRINSFLKQKKEFLFKQKAHEIGGDICISQNLTLKNRRYIVFLNADAMGKSIQGAGGILVLGSVFQSIIQRTESYSTMSKIPPEQWIKNAFKELHKIFESFDGSMLISLILGIVEENTGLVYYINAEHPWMILYRDGVADFIESEMYFRKLGTPGMENDIFVSTFEMAPGDMLIMGSDGKDDLVMDQTTENRRVINEDEFLFLKRVEEAKGNLGKICSVIQENYELMDDLSLLSIEYLQPPVNPEAEEEKQINQILRMSKKYLMQENHVKATDLLESAHLNYPANTAISHSLIKLYMKQKNYKRAAVLCKEFLEHNEADTSVMLKASYCMKMNYEVEDAIEISERIKLREPYNVKNLVLLADMYTYKNNFPRVEKLLNKISKLEPDNKWAIKIKDRVKKVS
ncbi:MAG: SpoIIE family protein phosphatase [Leptospiraceae bacterium]|nr:SpoIIE family protein phosphatase [Leptospiraceae bacterium]